MRRLAGAFVCALVSATAACGSSGSGLDDASVNPNSTPSAYLLTLASLPSADQSPDSSYITYEIDLGPAPAAHSNAQALIAARAASSQASMPHAEQWAARLAYEQTRHAQMRAMAANPPVAGAGLRAKRAVVAGCTASSSCSTGQMCWHGQCTATPQLNFIDGSALPCTLTEVVTTANGTGINVLLDANVTMTSALRTTLHNAVTAFASTFDLELGILGQSAHSGVVDRDGDGRFTVAFTNATSASTGSDPNALTGFFSVADFLPAGPAINHITPSGNEADILWVRVPDPNKPGIATIAGTIAHEYLHMTSYALRVQSGAGLGQEDLWLDEATAHLMEDLTGWGSSNIRVAEQALEYWNDKGVLATGEDTLQQRGQGYMLLRYLVDQAAKKSGAADAAGATPAATTFVSALLREKALGWQHAAFQQMGKSGVAAWLRAVYTTGLTSANAYQVHAGDYLPVGTSSATQVKMGINPRGAFVDADGAEVDLRGPQTTPLPYSSDHFSNEVLASGSTFFTVDDFDARKATLVSASDPNSGPFLFPVVVQVIP